MKKVLSAVVAVGALAIGVSACSTKSSGAAPAAPTAQQETLVYHSSWKAEEPQSKIFQAILDDFARAHNVRLDVQFVGPDRGEDLAAEMAAGKGPDLFDASTGNIPALRAQNLLAPLEDVLPAQVPGEGKSVAEVLPDSVKAASSDEKGLAFIPHTVVSTAVWYDAHRNPEMAINPPRTWDEMISYLEIEKSSDKIGIGQDGTVPSANAYWFYSALVRAAGPGSLMGLSTDAANWEKPEVLTAAEQVEQLVKGGYFQKDHMTTQYPDAQDD